MTDPILNPNTHTTEFQEYIRRPPSFEDTRAFLRHKYGASLDEVFVHEWHDDMEGDCWADAQGHTIRN